MAYLPVLDVPAMLVFANCYWGTGLASGGVNASVVFKRCRMVVEDNRAIVITKRGEGRMLYSYIVKTRIRQTFDHVTTIAGMRR
jgi:hypothetical protein